ncbi:MAG: response regulator [Vicinamibacterales bacterium]|jgi:pseudo-response regulator 5|nr:response regulator [Vicinamibacterales bacterium]
MPVRVLIADGDSTTRTLLAGLLSDLKCAVTAVENGVEALAQLNKRQYSLLLLDVHMPVKGGLETLGEIRRSGPHQSLPVVLVSVDDGADVVDRAIALGIADFLVKPLRPTRTSERLARVLQSLESDVHVRKC